MKKLPLIAILLLLLGAVPFLYPGLFDSDEVVAETEQNGKLILHEDFSNGMEEWWIEGGERVWIKDERLHVKADPEDKGNYVATVWNRKPILGNVRIEIKAQVISSSIGANNINIFFFYSDPDGTPLYETRTDRPGAVYKYYHDLNGYIVTFLRDPDEMSDKNAQARFRLRRCPGFNLVDQSFDEIGVHAGQTYELVITRKDGLITFEVDGKQHMEWEDRNPLEEGLLGLRTYRTYLWWDDIRVYQLD